MKAIVVHPAKDAPRLSWEEVPDIRIGPEEVRVRAHATAVNRADLLQARGQYPPPPGESEILGLEVAGEIVELGSAVRGWKRGDRVCALLAGGGYAEEVKVHHRMLVKLPDDWDYTRGAAVMEVWLTAFSNLFMEGDLQPEQRVLIHAGGSGVGTAAIQLARSVGAVVYTTAGDEKKLENCRKLGASLTVSYKESDFVAAVKDASGGEGVHLILDPVGASYLKPNLSVLREGGCLIVIGLLGGAKAELDLGLVLGKSLKIAGTRLRSRPLSEKIRITREFEARFWPELTASSLTPVIDSVYPITRAAEAHRKVAENKTNGKVILTMEHG